MKYFILTIIFSFVAMAQMTYEEAMCKAVQDEESTSRYYSFLPGEDDFCQELKRVDLTSSESFLGYCFDSLRDKILQGNKPLSYKKTFENLFLLSSAEQEFMAFVLTGYGEGRSTSDKEVAMIFKTLDNRKNYAYNKGCINVNVLDVALQRFQFSMWNYSDPNWKKAVTKKSEEHSEKKQIKRMIKIYKNYKSKLYSFEPKQVVDKIYHYRTKNIHKIPAWGRTSEALRYVKVSKENIGAASGKKNSHYFFQKVAWSFNYHPHRKVRKGESECY